MLIDQRASETLLKKYKIRFFPKVDGEIRVHGGDAAFERFTQHLPGQFMPLGAYSYSQSFFGPVSRIGRYCSIGKNVKVMGDAHPLDWLSTNPIFYRKRRARFGGSKRASFPPFDAMGAPVVIENDVWIGDDVTLGHGVHLGTGCVVASGAIVTKDVPPYAIVGGTPAKVIRKRFEEPLIASLLDSQWWRFPISAWDDHDITSPAALIETMEDVRQSYDELPDDRMTFPALYHQLLQG